MAKDSKAWHERHDLPWAKVWDLWFTCASHRHLDVGCLGFGIRCLQLANARGRQADGSGFILAVDAAPLALEVIAREAHCSLFLAKKFVTRFLECGTMSRRDGDGALGFRNLKKWQEDPSTERKRKAKAVRANGREIHAESHASEREIHEQDDQTIRRSDPEEERESNAPREIHAGKRPRKPKPAPLAPRDFVPAPRVVELWNLRVHPHGLSKVVSLPPKRKGHIESRMRAKDASGAVRDEAWLVALFQRVTASDFMRGTNDRGWIADIDFVFNETNIAKILEGKYDNRKGVTKLPARAEPQVARREIEAERNRLWMQEEKKRIAAILAKDAEDKAAQ